MHTRSPQTRLRISGGVKVVWLEPVMMDGNWVLIMVLPVWNGKNRYMQRFQGKGHSRLEINVLLNGNADWNAYRSRLSLGKVKSIAIMRNSALFYCKWVCSQNTNSLSWKYLTNNHSIYHTNVFDPHVMNILPENISKKAIVSHCLKTNWRL